VGITADQLAAHHKEIALIFKHNANYAALSAAFSGSSQFELVGGKFVPLCAAELAALEEKEAEVMSTAEMRAVTNLKQGKTSTAAWVEGKVLVARAAAAAPEEEEELTAT